MLFHKNQDIKNALSRRLRHKIGTLSIFLVAALFSGFQSYAQLTVDADLRSRYEYRHGFKTLIPENTDAAQFVQQRTRIKTNYQSENVQFFLSVQDIRTWGDVNQLNSADGNGFSLHEAWAKVKFSSTISAKIGRQEIVHSNARIFGNVDWAMQARSHDAVVVSYAKDGFKADVGGAFNQDGPSLTGTTLMNPSTYKSLQYLWATKKTEKMTVGVLVLNNGLQFVHDSDMTQNATRFSQTVGAYLKWKGDRLSGEANGYYQMGEDRMANEVAAFLAGLEVNYEIQKFTVGAGFELQSGNDTVPNAENTAFTPFYGTNHKFNGLMDYFYVGNHIGGPGLQDLYAKVGCKLGEKSSIVAVWHNFNTAEVFAADTDTYLGDELDIVFVHKVNPDVIVKAGYSQMFVQDGMQALKGVTNNEVNNWGWLMLIVKPNLFQSTN